MVSWSNSSKGECGMRIRWGKGRGALKLEIISRDWARQNWSLRKVEAFKTSTVVSRDEHSEHH